MSDYQCIVDQRFMARAIQLADKGRYTVRPNPKVGCVIVKDGQLLAEGWHYRAGAAHAEIDALEKLNNSGGVNVAKGATAYVTLEPCAHQGRTGACANALVAAGIARVVFAMEDPNPLVSGKGLAILRDGGVAVEGPLLAEQAEALNRGFISRMRTNKPWVRCKIASSLDGRTAMASGESQWITGPAARRDVQLLRANSCAVVTGIGSVKQDDSRLTLRADELELDNVDDVLALPPLRVIIDSQLSVSPDAAIFNTAGDGNGGGRVIIFTLEEADQEKQAKLLSEHPSVTIEKVAAHFDQVDLNEVLSCLANDYQCNEVLLEAGATLSGAFLQAGLIDEYVIYQAPVLLGSQARPLVELPLNSMSEKVALTITDQRAVGNDLRITATVSY